MATAVRDGALKQLQSELLALKEIYAQLKLSKTPAGKSADAPFPITLTMAVDAPPAANRYDVDHLEFKIKLASSILQDPPAADAVTVAVQNVELPAMLRTRISKQLHSAWLAVTTEHAASTATVQADVSNGSNINAARPFGLAALLSSSRRDFVQLITLMPELIEAYEGTDASGATQRRFAVVENAAASTAAEAEAAGHTEPAAEPAAIQNAPASLSSAAAAAATPPAEEVTAATAGVTDAAAAAADVAAEGNASSSSSKSPKSHRDQHMDSALNTQSAQPLSAKSQPAAAAALPPLLSQSQGVLSAAAAPWTPPLQHPHPTSPPQAAPTTAAEGSATALTAAAAAVQASTAPVPQRPPGLSSSAAAKSNDAIPSPCSTSLPQPRAQYQSQQQQQQQMQQMHSMSMPSGGAVVESPGFLSAEGAPVGVAAGDHALSVAAAAVLSSSLIAGGRAHRGGARGQAGRVGAAGGRGVHVGRGLQQQQQQQQLQQVQQQQLPGHILAQQDVSTVQRRYGRSFRLVAQQQQQQQQQQLAEGQQQQQEQEQQQQVEQQQFLEPQHFSLMLRPTDPLWGAQRGSLHVLGLLKPVQYPAAGSITLTVNPSLNVTAAEVWVLQSRLDHEAQQSVGRSRQLMSLLKWLENYAGSVLEECYQAQQQLFGQEQQQGQQEQQQQQLQSRTSALEYDRGQHSRRRGHQPSDPYQQNMQQQQPQQQQQQLPLHRQQRRWRGSFHNAEQQQQQPAVSRPRATAASAGTESGIKILRAAKQGVMKSAVTTVTDAAAAAASSNADSWGSEGNAIAAGAQQKGNGEQRGWISGSQEAGHSSSSSSSSGSSRELFPSGRKLLKQGRDCIATDYCTTRSQENDDSSSSEYTTTNDSQQEGSSSGSDHEHDSEREDEVQLHGESAGGGISTGPGGYALTFSGLKLDNIGIMEIVHAQLQLLCDRCQASLAVVLTAEGGHISTPAAAAGGLPASPGSTANIAAAAAAAGGGGHRAPLGSSSSSSSKRRAFEWSGACATCSHQLGVLLRPRFIHGGNNVVAGVKAQGCLPLDLLPSVYGATCAECDAVGALRRLQVGVATTRKCSHCHRTMTCDIPAASFVPRGPESAAAAAAQAVKALKAGTAGRAGGKRGVLQEGVPLPMNGACKHYKHSYRWLRFPCCGQRYACDLCHEEATADGHDAAWATRMVCGFCSREQLLDKACKYCSKKLATSAVTPSGRNTRFWEGGKGCRDVKMLDRRDAHKYRNSKAKTKSAKASRVGPKRWSGSTGAAAAAPAGGGGGSSN